MQARQGPRKQAFLTSTCPPALLVGKGWTPNSAISPRQLPATSGPLTNQHPTSTARLAAGGSRPGELTRGCGPSLSSLEPRGVLLEQGVFMPATATPPQVHTSQRTTGKSRWIQLHGALRNQVLMHPPQLGPFLVTTVLGDFESQISILSQSTKPRCLNTKAGHDSARVAPKLAQRPPPLGRRPLPPR